VSNVIALFGLNVGVANLKISASSDRSGSHML
jgi:hypothetical protein